MQKNNGANDDPTEFYNWWPGWDRSLLSRSYKALEPIPGGIQSGIALKRKFDDRLTDYYFWSLTPVNTTLPYMCERPQMRSEVGCFVGNGDSYNGQARRTESGTQCLFWNSTDVRRFLSQEEVDKLGSDYETNMCRNPGGTNDPKPWCFTVATTGDIEYCDIPECEGPARAAPTGQVPAAAECEGGYFQCENRCILTEYVCDGKPDCGSGDEDEENCEDFNNDIVDEFSRRQGKKLDVSPTEQWVILKMK